MRHVFHAGSKYKMGILYKDSLRRGRMQVTYKEHGAGLYFLINCIFFVTGTHYYYNMTESLKCEELLPWFALVSQGELVGTGLQVFGRLAHNKHRDWFENPPAPKRSAEITIPYAPPCLLEWAASYGVVSLHIYYVDKPWTIRCRAGDSVKPAPALDRLILNGYRYASQVADEVKKLFSG